MTTYTRLPQFEHVELQRTVPSDDHYQHHSIERTKAIRSITISNETRADGSIVRRKETLFTNGETMVEEKELSRPLHAGIRYVPITPPIPHLTRNTTDNILPLYHRYPRPLMTTKESSGTDDGRGLFCQLGILVVVILVLFQVLLWYMIISGQATEKDIPAFLHIFRQFHYGKD